MEQLVDSQVEIRQAETLTRANRELQRRTDSAEEESRMLQEANANLRGELEVSRTQLMRLYEVLQQQQEVSSSRVAHTNGDHQMLRTGLVLEHSERIGAQQRADVAEATCRDVQEQVNIAEDEIGRLTQENNMFQEQIEELRKQLQAVVSDAQKSKQSHVRHCRDVFKKMI